MDKQQIIGLAEWYNSPEFEKEYGYAGDDLGARYTAQATTWKVWSPLAEEVILNLYATGSDAEASAQNLDNFPLQKGKEAGIWQLTLNGDFEGVYYTYTITQQGVREETADIYARATGVNGQRSMVIDLPRTNPTRWEEDDYHFDGVSTEAIIWETHVQDFSVHESSGMTHKGKFLAFTETGTTVDNDGKNPTGIDYLKDLGITHVHLLPIADFATVDEAKKDPEAYNWGYDPLNYNVPEGSYATDPFDGHVRIREFKELVLALHQAGIGVIMDVVYNHTYYTEKSFFQKTVPYYYHRTLPDGRFGDASACGNETASERVMMRRYILDSVRYWAEEYHIDGFRFDLMGIHDTDLMNEVRDLLDGLPYGHSRLLYGEPWSAFPTALPEGKLPANKANVAMLDERIAVFDDETRDTIKGSAFDVEQVGFVNGGKGLEEKLQSAICAHAVTGPMKAPSQAITYVSSHDNYTLWDKITLSVPGDSSGYDAPEMIRLAVNKLAAALVLTSQGTAFFQAGEEFGRSKYGDHNSYRSAPDINGLNWRRTIRFEELKAYYKGLIQIRKAFAVLTEPDGKSIEAIRFVKSQDNVVAYTLPLSHGETLAVCFNAGSEDCEIEFDEDVRRWQVLADERNAGLNPLYEIEGNRLNVRLRGVLIAKSVKEETVDDIR